MSWKNRAVALAWAVFAVWSAAWLVPRWFVDMPLRDGAAFLPSARSGFIDDGSGESWDSFLSLVNHYVFSPDHVEELERTPGIERVVLEKPEPAVFPTRPDIDHIVVDGTVIMYDEYEDPIKGPILARALRDTAKVEWRMLRERAWSGTAAWAATLVPMLVLTWWARRADARPRRAEERR